MGVVYLGKGGGLIFEAVFIWDREGGLIFEEMPTALFACWYYVISSY